MKIILQSLKVYVVYSILLGVAYPLFITFVAQKMMTEKANGSLFMEDNRIAGSFLIGQEFSKPEYFQSRPSANAYDATNSGGTNRGPTSKKLLEEAAARIELLRREDGLASDAAMPADRVLASASGLDPHISPENALSQAPRISHIRQIPMEDLRKMIAAATDADFLGLWGRPAVNVLKLNSALDAMNKKQ